MPATNPLLITGPVATDMPGVFIRAEYQPKCDRKGNRVNTNDKDFARELVDDAFCDEKGEKLPPFPAKLGAAQSRRIIFAFMGALDKVGKDTLEANKAS